ncbi:MAG: hypothetical protein KatS3mg027_0353 [Bacteroidia bacterium]|nr:MAG: hypothetical protein KatS3mg027_0353 [Bacteroidia bacterium]
MEAKSLIGSWLKGLVRLKQSNFTESEIAEINSETSHFVELLLQFYDYGEVELYEMVNASVEDWFNGITELKKNGFSFEEIRQFMEDIKDAFYYIEYEYDEWDEDDYEDEDFDEDEDDDDEDDDDEFDPRKFFPKR